MPELQLSAKLKQKRWTPCKGLHNRSADRSTAAELLDPAQPHTASWWGQRNEPSNLLFIPSLSDFQLNFTKTLGSSPGPCPLNSPALVAAFKRTLERPDAASRACTGILFIPLLFDLPSRCVTRATMSLPIFLFIKDLSVSRIQQMDFCGFGGFAALLMQEEMHPAREHLQENPPLMAKSCSAHVIVIPSGKGGNGIKG